MSDPKDTDSESNEYNPDETTLEFILETPDWWNGPTDSVIDKNVPKRKYSDEPEDNIGRSHCFWCGESTVKKPLLNTVYDYCEKCKK